MVTEMLQGEIVLEWRQGVLGSISVLLWIVTVARWSVPPPIVPLIPVSECKVRRKKWFRGYG